MNTNTITVINGKVFYIYEKVSGIFWRASADRSIFPVFEARLTSPRGEEPSPRHPSLIHEGSGATFSCDAELYLIGLLLDSE